MSARLPARIAWVRYRAKSPLQQRGIALLVIAILLSLGLLALLIGNVNPSSVNIEREKITNQALAQAKSALIAYASGLDLTQPGNRPGDLPCPDRHTFSDPLVGTPSTPCNGAANQLGRLPWKSLGLPDLRDGAGERLWYAVSANFKNSSRTGTLNSDTPGTITIRDTSGAVKFDGRTSVGTGAIAVVIAPGSALTRLDGVVQNRSAAGYNQAINYLDKSGSEDNINFANNNLNGFIEGDVLVNGTPIVNDRIATILPSDLMPALEARVANEALFCLKEYALQLQNKGRYPWAADLSASGSSLDYSGRSGTLFGRMPDDFSDTFSDSGGAMKNGWTTDCNLNLGTWFTNWREQIFYALADAYKPITPVVPPACGACLSINIPTTIQNRQVVVIAAGKALPGQDRSNKSIVGPYLEGENASPADTLFVQSGAPLPFNDRAVYAP